MIKFLIGLLFSINAFAALTDVDRAEILPQNVISNGGFESSSAGWTASGGSLAIATSGSNLLIGRGSATWDSNGAAQTFISKNIAVSNGLKGRNGAASCVIMTPSGTATHTLQVYDGSSILVSSTVVSSTSPTRTSVNFVYPSSGSVRVRIVAVAANEPSITIDSCYLGAAEGLNLILADKREIFSAKTDGNSPSVVSDENQNWINGNCTRSGAGVYQCPLVSGIFATAPNCQVTTKAAASTDDIACRVYNVSTSTVDFSCGATVTGTETSVAANLSCQKTSTDAANLAYTPDITSQSWSGYHDSTCSWARTNTAYGDPTADASCALTERTNNNFGTVSTSGSVLPAITFTPKKAGRYYVCALAQSQAGTNGIFPAARLWDGTTVVSESEQGGSTNTLHATFSLCGIYNATSTTAVTLSVQTKASSGAITLGSSSANSAIEWSIFAIDNSFPAPAIANSVVTTSNSVIGNEFSKLNCDAGSAITSQLGSWVSSIGNVSGGACTVTLAAGIFSATPYCTASVDASFASVGLIVSANATSSTSVTIDCEDDASTACTAYDIVLHCAGTK